MILSIKLINFGSIWVEVSHTYVPEPSVGGEVSQNLRQDDKGGGAFCDVPYRQKYRQADTP